MNWLFRWLTPRDKVDDAVRHAIEKAGLIPSTVDYAGRLDDLSPDWKDPYWRRDDDLPIYPTSTDEIGFTGLRLTMKLRKVIIQPDHRQTFEAKEVLQQCYLDAHGAEHWLNVETVSV